MYKVFFTKGEVKNLANKKSIFERLGLIEISVKEGNIESINEPDINEQDNNLLENTELDVNAYAEKDEQEIQENEVTLETSDISINQDIELSINRMKEIGDDMNQALDQEGGIEEKLDVLIGAFEKNKLLTIDEIYKNYKLILEPNKTIFMGDILMKALPENLPLDIKRESVLSIMEVSNIEKEDLLNDAYKRIDALNTVLKDTIKNTEEIVAKNEASIKELERRIEDLKQATEEKLKLKEDQNTIIEYEIQKIINIVEFIKPKK